VIYQTGDLNAKGIKNEEIKQMLFEIAAGPWVDIEGIGGQCGSQLDGLLVVTQSRGQQREVSEILAKLRSSNPTKHKSKSELTIRSYRLDNLPLNREKSENSQITAITSAAMTIQALVEPDSWSGKHAGTIHTVGRLLIVRQTIAVHQKIQEFISKHLQSPAIPTVED